MVGLLKAGTTVEAITGEVHVRPIRFVVKKSQAEYKPGDVLVYTAVLVQADDPIRALGMQLIILDVEDASLGHDQYLYDR